MNKEELLSAGVERLSLEYSSLVSSCLVQQQLINSLLDRVKKLEVKVNELSLNYDKRLDYE